MNNLRLFLALQPLFGDDLATKLAWLSWKTAARYALGVTTLGLCALATAYLITGLGFWLGLRWHVALIAGAIFMSYKIGGSYGR